MTAMVIERDNPQEAPASKGRVPRISWASGAAMSGSGDVVDVGFSRDVCHVLPLSCRE